MVGEGYSSKFSAYLAYGCMSPRRAWAEAQRYEQERVKNKSTYWLGFELTWRDFFVYMGRSYGDKIFFPGGISGDSYNWKGGKDALLKWKQGRTGDQLVDANMKELLASGFMSNRGRQNVASYLIFDLGVDWRYGAAHFEEHLLDYDPCSNWGNWVAAAGLTGQRVNRFNTKKQLNDYDPKREYINVWLKDGPPTAMGRPMGPADGSEANAGGYPSKGSGKGGSGKGEKGSSGKGEKGAKGKGKGKERGDDDGYSAKKGRWGRKDAHAEKLDDSAWGA